MKYLILSTIFLILSGCANNQPQHKQVADEEVYYIHNEGVICVEKIAKDRLKFTSIPLNEICVSPNLIYVSSSNIYVTPAGAEYKVENSAKYTKYKTTPAPRCGSRGVTHQVVPILGIGTISISMGNVMLGKFSNEVGDISCYKKTKSGVYKDESFIKEYKKLKNIKYDRLYI